MKKLMLGLLMSTFMFGVSTVNADEKTKNEGWDIPTVSLGNGLSDSEQKETLKALGVQEGEKYNLFYVNGDDLVKYVTDITSFNSNSLSYSSAYMVRTKEGSGVRVSITTPENITDRDASTYRNASITSGVYDATIKIASVRVMDGSGALAGIYKAFDEIDPATTEEEALDRAERRGLAQEEMGLTSDILNNETATEGSVLNAETLAVALANLKLEMQEMNNKLSEMAEDKAREIVVTTVNNELQKQGIDKDISEEQVNKIVNFLMAFRKTSLINDEKVKEQLKNLTEDIKENGKEFLNNAKDKLTSEETKSGIANIWKAIVEFFKNLFSKN